MSRVRSSLPASRAGALLAHLRLALVMLVAVGCLGIADPPDVEYSAICANYCDEVLNTCNGVQQYDDRRTCLKSCVLLDKAALGSTSIDTNSIACRLRQVAAAQSSGQSSEDLLSYCAAAGPGGSDKCTVHQDQPYCEGYCALYSEACGGRSKNPYDKFDSAGTETECIDKCQALAPALAQDYTSAQAQASGDTVGCRLYFASAAALDPDANCISAGLRPEGVCAEAPNCETFCRVVGQACQGPLKVYEDDTQCMQVCAVLDTGSKSDIGSQDTVGCRTAHAYNALLVSDTDHCPHTGPFGANVCGNRMTGNCDAYCRLSKLACADQYAAAFPNGDPQCLDACSGLPGAGKLEYAVTTADASGDSVQCRELYVARALTLPQDKRDDAACSPVFGAAPCD